MHPDLALLSTAWYLTAKDNIPNLLDTDLPLQQQAEQAYGLRVDMRSWARDLMADRDTAAYLDDLEPHPTFDQLVLKYSQKYTGDDVWQAIIEASQRSRSSLDAALGFK